MNYYICLAIGAIFGYVIGAIMATGANADEQNERSIHK